MSSFISKSACRGVKPNNVILKNMYPREHLISKLMSQRQVLRLISAPNGFGKTTLVGQYAELVFSFKNVFWIDCKSPCFIRDLDNYEIVSQIIEICETPKLIVFEDIAALSEDRLIQFSKVIDDLLQLGSEVILTCSPITDDILKYQSDCLTISSFDLLLNEDEQNSSLLKSLSENETKLINKIPQMAWKENGIKAILSNALKEDFTNAISFSLFYIYLLGNCSIEELSKFITQSDINLLIDICDKYIYFGYDSSSKTFTVPKINVELLFSAFENHIKLINRYFSVNTKSRLCLKLIKILEHKKDWEKIAHLINLLGDKETRLNYLSNWSELSIQNLYLKIFCDLYESVSIVKNDDGLIGAYESLRLAILGNTSAAIKSSYSVLDSKTSTIDNKLLATITFVRFGSSLEKIQAIKIIRCLINDFKVDSFLNNKLLSQSDKQKCKIIKKVLDIYLSIYSESRNPFEVWVGFCSKQLEIADIVSAECILSSASYIHPEHFSNKSYKKFSAILSRFFANYSNSDLNFYTYALLKSYLDVFLKLNDIEEETFWNGNLSLFNLYKKVDLRFCKEKDKYWEMENYRKAENNISKIFSKDLTSANEFDNSKDVNNKIDIVNNTPIIKVKVLGGLFVSIGNREIIDGEFGRHNIKLLCCLLAIKNGQEINKSRLAEIIWPDSDDDSRYKNLNSHWSILRKTLSLPNGECPYLIRNQWSYKFNKKYLRTDIEDLEEICADLIMGSLDPENWWSKFKNNQNILYGDLLPAETSNSYIKQKRNEYKNMFVNALVAASQRLLEAGEFQQSLWFINKALARDPMREDVYVTMMEAQLKSGQRTPALETYFACKKFLDDELGIEPSKKTNELYKKIVCESNL